jgi:predicted TPR repeat methyltransferase
MNPKGSQQAHDESAGDYDRLAREYHWFPEAIFGLCYEYLGPQQRLLDIGIGTGLSAHPFAKADLQVYGLDTSREMLKACELKGIAAELRQFDIRMRPWPYPDGFFDHAIACGVFHFIDDLEPIFREAARVIRARGIFAFTTKAPHFQNDPESYHEKYASEIITGVTLYLHKRPYIDALLASCGFEMLKELSLLVDVGQGERKDVFHAFMTQNLKSE